MIRAFFMSAKYALFAYGFGSLLVLSIGIQVCIAVRLNSVFGDAFDILGNIHSHTKKEFLDQMYWWILLSLINDFLIVVPSSYLTRLYALTWRGAINEYYQAAWDAHPLKFEGASQRVEVDIHSFVNTVMSLFLGFLSAVMTLIGFLPILWHLGKGLDVPFLPQADGLLVWLTLTICFVSTGISWLVGIKLPDIENQRRNADAAFRNGLVLTEDKEIFVGKMRFSPFDNFVHVIRAQRLYFRHIAYYEGWTSIYALFLEVLPYFIGLDALFAGTILLGHITKMNDAFGNTKSSFSFFIDKWTWFTELWAVQKRLKELEAHLGLRKD
jgi:peptide/bleomycin uptake transporter